MLWLLMLQLFYLKRRLVRLLLGARPFFNFLVNLFFDLRLGPRRLRLLLFGYGRLVDFGLSLSRSFTELDLFWLWLLRNWLSLLDFLLLLDE